MAVTRITSPFTRRSFGVESRHFPETSTGRTGNCGGSTRQQPDQLLELIIPPPTVTPVASSIRMNEPVVRFLL